MTHWFTSMKGRVLVLGSVFLVTAGFTVASGQVQWGDMWGSLALDGSRDMGFVLAETTIEGNVRTSAAAVLGKLDMDVGTPMYSIDLEAVRRSVEALPWVKSADVQRKLPGTLFVRIEEREPFVLWQNNNRLTLVDRDGVAIAGTSLADFRHLRLYVGPQAHKVATSLEAALESVPDLASRLTSVVHVGERRFDLVFRGGVRVKLPETHASNELRGALAKLQTLEQTYQLLERDVTVIDLRLDDRLILRVNPDVKPRINPQYAET